MMKDLGIDSFAGKIYLADVLRRRNGSVFEEGLVDVDDDLYDAKLESLQSVLITRYGKTGNLD